MTIAIPERMRGVRVVRFLEGAPSNISGCLEVHDELEVPRPARGQVLVRVERCAIAPSDFAQARGIFGGQGGQKPGLPMPIGTEASGVVVASGGGVLGRTLVGRRVGFGAAGNWQEYVCADATACIRLPADVAHLQSLPFHRVAGMAMKVPGLLKSDLRTQVRSVYPFEQAEQAILDYVSDMTGGKIVLTARR